MISLTALTNLNNVVSWGLWVSIYIWLVGISAGSFILVAWINIKGKENLKQMTRLGLSLALATLCIGLLSIQIDLGRIERFYKLFTSPNFASVMDLMVWLYGVYFAVLVISLLRLKKGISKPFFLCSLVLASATIILESLLFARPPGKHWHSMIFPIHFFTASLVSAIAALIFMAGIFQRNRKSELLKGLSKIALPLVIVNLIVELIEVFSSGSFIRIGSLSVLLGNFIVIVLLRRRSPVSITVAGCIGLLNVWLSKYNSLISAQLIEPFRGFAKSYVEPRLVVGYTPNNFEFFFAVILIGVAGGLFFFLYKVLPITREE